MMELQLQTIRKMYYVLKDAFCYECQKGNCDDCKIGVIREQLVALEKEYNQTNMSV